MLNHKQEVSKTVAQCSIPTNHGIGPESALISDAMESTSFSSYKKCFPLFY